MRPAPDRELVAILAGVFGLLVLVTAIAWLIRSRAREAGRASAENQWARTRTFWQIA